MASMSVMKQILAHFSKSALSEWRIEHKQLWLEFIETGKLPFTFGEIHSALREIIDKPENRPRGQKLLDLRKRYSFTLKADKAPDRPEEALERFIVISNDDNFYNQVPVGGGKESVDIAVEHSDKSINFVELKPWNSGNSPLYALIESLKNLVEYRIIIERDIKAVKNYAEVNISLLAPKEYYAKYFLVDDIGFPEEANITKTNQLLGAVADEFNTQVAFHSFKLPIKTFKEICSQIYDRHKLVGQDIATVRSMDSITSLNKANWTEIASSNAHNC